jgi:hypothetical protein
MFFFCFLQREGQSNAGCCLGRRGCQVPQGNVNVSFLASLPLVWPVPFPGPIFKELDSISPHPQFCMAQSH